jgi:hypothetical protein
MITQHGIANSAGLRSNELTSFSGAGNTRSSQESSQKYFIFDIELEIDNLTFLSR